MKDKTYNYNLITCEKIITEKDLSNGNLILLASRPCIGKTKTCVIYLNIIQRIIVVYILICLVVQAHIFLATKNKMD